jgi:putative transposase
LRKSGAKEKGDERILGSGEFVSEVIRNAEEKVKRQLPAMELQKRIEDEIAAHCRNENVRAEMLQSGSRRPPLPKLRREIALKLVNEYGISLAETARQLGISTSAVAQILRREKGF